MEKLALTANHAPIVVAVYRWTARILGYYVFCLWGAFFIEHLAWLSDPSNPPPPSVLAGMFLHLLMLAGLS